MIVEKKSKRGKIFYGCNNYPKCKTAYWDMPTGEKCPNCGKRHNDNDEQYEVNNEQYPKYFNESKGATMDGSYWDWDEVHCCEDCETKYWFRNGAY